MSKKVLIFNSSALGETICPMRFSRSVLQGWREKQENNDTFYGTCFHKFVSEYELQKVKSPEDGIAFAKALGAAKKMWVEKLPSLFIKPKKEHLNLIHLMTTCSDWHEKFGEGKDDYTVLKDSKGQPLVELKLHVPYYSDPDLDVILAGTIDSLGKISQGVHAIRDFKTTSIWDKRGYLEGYEMAAQLKFYKYLVTEYAKMFPTSIFADIVKNNSLSAVINGVFLSSNKPTEFMKSDAFPMKQDTMEEFEFLLDTEVAKAVTLYKDFLAGHAPARTGLISGACKGFHFVDCPFINACKAPNSTIVNHVLHHNFTQKEWGMEVYGGAE